MISKWPSAGLVLGVVTVMVRVELLVVQVVMVLPGQFGLLADILIAVFEVLVVLV